MTLAHAGRESSLGGGVGVASIAEHLDRKVSSNAVLSHDVHDLARRAREACYIETRPTNAPREG